MPVTPLQIPVGPEVFVILLVALTLFVILLGIGVVVLVGLRRQQSGDEAESRRSNGASTNSKKSKTRVLAQ
ncbi:hypothetical protein [Halohasta litorea]|uniref:Uncharacterized protein n=1 Tax=Halohasta litorea TaxID=869891 RepID=A0ABD6DBN0_9EURY|nr:hypothetical protein [Halohasta litorea]